MENNNAISKYFPVSVSYNIYFYHVPDNNDRRRIHNYIQKFLPELLITSLTCGFFKKEFVTFFKCKMGDRLVRMEYSKGFESNNQDEYYSGWCDSCDDYHFWECNYDDKEYVVRKYSGNIIAFGPFFTGYQSRGTVEKDAMTEEDMNNFFCGRTLYSVDAPTQCLNKKRLGKYIKKKLESNEYVTQSM